MDPLSGQYIRQANDHCRRGSRTGPSGAGAVMTSRDANIDLSFREKDRRLADRIRANKLFGDFDLETWVTEHVGSLRWNSVLDIGCGDGNHLGIYLENGPSTRHVVGLDRDAALLEQARKRYGDADGLELLQHSMDDPLPFADTTFGLVMSVFAIYNARNPATTLQEIHRVMQPGARLTLIGPTVDNGKELYEFNERLTSQRIDERTLARSQRLVDEFLPIVHKIFDSCEHNVIEAKLTFPDRHEFLRYYTSTMLYEETAEGRGYSPSAMADACSSTHNLRLSKETVVITAQKD
ncbi:class I SAM-dependent methyltransferase [Nocardia sp. CA-135953]|uniref:class I SAM-dependent methyltransferase n=1 Tax=Nocardia sp. CA-135953 TaxID=3239978 RepID=UPI003D989CDB